MYMHIHVCSICLLFFVSSGPVAGAGGVQPWSLRPSTFAFDREKLLYAGLEFGA